MFNPYQQYQNMLPQQPINIYNNSNRQPEEVRGHILNENEKVEELFVQTKTLVFDPFKGKLTIKENDGTMKSFDVILPKTPEQIENEQLKLKIHEMEVKLNGYVNESTNTNEPSKTVKNNEE